MDIPVLEIFGPTLQGEGSVIGRKTVFVRTAGCDYKCKWCDSKFTWDGSEKATLMSVGEIISKLGDIGFDNFDHVTISGGNPALIGKLGELIFNLHDYDIKVAVETQGSKWQGWFYDVDDLTLSPKPPSSGMDTDFLQLAQILDRVPTAVLKIVVFDDEDYKYAKYLHKLFPDHDMYLQVGNDDVETENLDSLTAGLLDKLEWLADKVTADKDMNDVRVLPQLHTLIWGNRRGV